MRGTIVTITSLFILTGCLKSEFKGLGGNELIENQYIVVLKKNRVEFALKAAGGELNNTDVVHSMASSLAAEHGAQIQRFYTSALKGAVYHMTKEQADAVAKDPAVAYVEQDRIIHINSVESNPTWGLDRIDQSDLPLDQSYTYNDSTQEVHAYIIDTGILTTHVDFEGRADSAIDIVDSDSDATDCNGHGTHVAGTIGSATYGVDKHAHLHAVRVLDCKGSGSYSNVIAGIDWVTQNHQSPAVANMSLGGPVSQAIDDAISNSILSGVTYVVAAGNENTLACDSSPARLDTAITVGATDNTDKRAYFSNYGTCVDIFAPGLDIKSLWYNSNSATNTISGTSMASPHVAGVVALYLADQPSATPAQVMAALKSGGVSGKLADVGTGSPNLLVDTGFTAGGDNGGSGGGDNGGSGSGDNGNPLQNYVPVANLAGTKGDDVLYTIDVPAQSQTFRVEISGGRGDADLYVSYGQEPSLNTYDCRPYHFGNSEVCNFDQPKTGTWYVKVRGYNDYSGLKLLAQYSSKQNSSQAPCTNCQEESGNLNGRAASAIHPSGGSYHSKSGLHQVWLEGPDRADFDLYLYRRSGSSWVEVAKSIKYKSSESIRYHGTDADYRIKVVSYNGSGAYKVWLKVPSE